MKYAELSREQLYETQNRLVAEYNSFCARGLSLDMSRGKPSPEQLALSLDMLNTVDSSSVCRAADGSDCRNYGLPDGIPEARALFAEMLEIAPEQVVIGGNSSLNLMFDCVSLGMTHGFGEEPWSACKKRKFLCPSPGYDRHFGITEYYGFEMIPIDMTPEGPDMDQVEQWVADPDVKGIWCVPKYSNPQGITYSDRTVLRMGALNPAAKDFRVFWDNSYAVHDLYGGDHLYNIFKACKLSFHEDLVLEFTSTSKITFSGAGISALAASENNLSYIRRRLRTQTIGFDKMNQLRHVRFLKDMDGIRAQMEKHARLIRPKFDVVLRDLSEKLSDSGIAAWSSPAGGYFISVDVLEGTAKRVVELCKNGGVKLTPAGATYPYGKDPRDSNIRIAPTFPPVQELELAMQLFCVCVQLAATEKLLSEV